MKIGHMLEIYLTHPAAICVSVDLSCIAIFFFFALSNNKYVLFPQHLEILLENFAHFHSSLKEKRATLTGVGQNKEQFIIAVD